MIHFRKWYVDLAIALLTGTCFFLILLSTPNIPGGDDAYRHVKMAFRLAVEPGAVFEDPWHLAYLWPKPVDAWFGYHLLLAPFAAVLPLILAVKLFSSLIFAGIAYVAILLMRQIEAHLPILWAIFAIAGSGTALYRATLSRPFLFSTLLVLLAALFTLRGKPVAVGLVSALHAASYSMFFLVGLVPVMAFLLRRDRTSTHVLLACGLGIGGGLLCNPYFPENVRFDVVVVAILGIAKAAHVRLGIELEPISIWWLAASVPVIALWIISAVRFLVERRAAKTDAALFFALSLVTLAASMQVSRTFDLFVPAAITFSAVMLSPWARSHRRDVPYAAGLLLAICGANIFLTYRNMRQAVPYERFRGVSQFLLTQAPGALVANAQWDEYPFLYFWNSRNRYVIGIEPTFLYVTDPHKYWLWRHIAEDEPSTCDHEHCAPSESADIAKAVSGQLNARYLLTEHARNPQVEAVLTTSGVQEVYRDAECSLYQIKP